VIVADNVAEYVYGSGFKETWDLERDFPCCAPPLPHFFLEMRIPEVRKHQGNFEETLPARVGWLVCTWDWGTRPEDEAKMDIGEADPAILRWGMISHLLVEDHSGRIIAPEVTRYSQIARDGQPAGRHWMDFPLTCCLEKKWQENEKILRFFFDLFDWLAIPMMMAICFLNCRKTTLRSIDPPPAVNRIRERAGRQPFVRYNVINIEPAKEILRTEGRSDTEGLKKALHICRGHFATFRENFMGRPLDGPLTIWRPAHLRGSIRQGVVVSDYNVNGPGPGAPG
jgi:hypothetical protein